MDTEKYKDKKFSVLGDSISTLQGYSEPNNAKFYDALRMRKAGLHGVEDTWWGQVIARLGGKLLVNNSISGSTVCRRPTHNIPSYACSDERTSALHTEKGTPDVIMIYMGTNDWGAGMPVFARPKVGYENLSYFATAYAKMLEKLKRNYPNAEIWCFTLPISRCSAREDFRFPYCFGGRHIEEYCDAIRACAETYECKVVDLYVHEEAYDTMDGFHPNASGMTTLANAVMEKL